MADCKVHLVIVLAFFLTAHTASAKNLGSIGNTYTVVESDLIEEIKANIDHDKLAKAMAEYRKPYKPKDIYPLPVATADRTFSPDMTYTLDHDIKGADGEIFYQQGLTWNPLDYVTLSGGLVVINGEDASQVEWFKTSPYAENHRVKLLLSAGYANELRDRLKRPVYYLTELIARRFQLAAVPCVILQEGRQMMVREVKIEKN